MSDLLHGLRLAVLAPISWPTPPPGYGPWEQIAYSIAAGMQARGLDVTLFATGNSQAPGKLSAIVPVGLEEDPGLNAEVYSALHIGKLFERAAEFDLIHNNFDWKPLTYGLATKAPPMITTIHGFSSPPILAAYYAGAARSFYCSISDSDRDPGLAYLATTYNGIDPGQWTFRAEPGEDLVFLARFHPEKGAHLAIEIAKKAGVRLKMAAIPQDDAYFKELVEPHIDGDQIQFLGHVKGKARDELLGTALALVHMTTRPERFGLTLIEAMACGTPVLGAAMGSIPEIVVDGETVFCALAWTMLSLTCRVWRNSIGSSAGCVLKARSRWNAWSIVTATPTPMHSDSHCRRRRRTPNGHGACMIGGTVRWLLPICRRNRLTLHSRLNDRELSTK